MTLYYIEPDIPFLSKQLTAHCRKAWRKFFSVLKAERVRPEWGDIALWVTEYNSASIFLSARSSGNDEEDPEWEAPPVFGFAIEGLCEELNRIRGIEQKRVIEEFRSWMNGAIVNSFTSKSNQRLYEQYNPNGCPFSVFASPYDGGLANSNLTLLWTNRTGLDAEQVVSKQAELGRGKRYTAVKKKSPAKSRAERQSGGRKRTSKPKKATRLKKPSP